MRHIEFIEISVGKSKGYLIYYRE